MALVALTTMNISTENINSKFPLKISRKTKQLQKQELSFSISFFNKANDNKPKLNEFSWRNFAAIFENPEIRQQKDGKLFSPAVFKGTRAKENVVSLSCLVLDYDHKANFESDTSIWKKLGYQFIAYTSHSHLRETKSNPNKEERFRVVLPLASIIAAKDFFQLWNWASKITHGKIDSAARDESRMFYLPAKTSESAPYKFEIFNGKLLDWRELNLESSNNNEIAASNKKKQSQNNYDGELREDARADARKLDLLQGVNEIFKLGWERKRTDMQDQSASAYEQSFANFTTQARWTFQEFLDLCVDFRCRHKFTPKAKKNSDALGYYKNTWHKAQVDFSASQKTQDEKRKDGIKLLKDELHLENLVKVGLRGETFELHLTDKIIVLGNAENLFSQTKIRARLLLERIKFVRKFDSTNWQKIVDAITDSFEAIETHTDAQEIMDLVIKHTEKTLWKDYDFDNTDYPSKEFDEDVAYIREKGLFDKKSVTVYLSLSFFDSWVNRPTRRYSPKELSVLLGRSGFAYKQKAIRVTDKDGKTSIINLGRFYVSPQDFFKDEVNFLSKLEDSLNKPKDSLNKSQL